jgi:uncharacterized protein (TIGR02594 family)
MIPARFGYLDGAARAPWLDAALREARAGVREVAGPKSHPRIIEYRRLAHVPLEGDDGKVPWCAIFTNAMLEGANVPGTRSGLARSYTRSDRFTRLPAPALGAITVLASPKRGPSAGHVGFYVGEDGLFVYLCGGNQNDAVNVSAYRKAQLIGHFWPQGVALPRAPWNAAYRLPIPPRKGAPARPARDD